MHLYRQLAVGAVLFGVVVGLGTVSESGSIASAAESLPTPISQYKFDETTGATTITDSIRGASGLGTLYGSPTFEPGKVGNALCLDGSTQYATAPLIGNGLSEATLSAWVKLDQRTPWATIAKNWGETAGSFHFGLDGAGQYWSNYIGTVNPTGAPDVNSSSAGLATTGSWQYVVTTVSQTQGKMFLYLNGTKVDEGTFSGTITGLGALMSFGVKLNNAQTGASTDGNPGWLDGCLDEVTFWNTALSEAQLDSIIEGGGGVTSSSQVTFDANGGVGEMSPQSSATATALSPNLFTRPGFRFAGWAISQAEAEAGTVAYTDTASYPFMSSATLYAVWVASSSPSSDPEDTAESPVSPQHVVLAETGPSPWGPFALWSFGALVLGAGLFLMSRRPAAEPTLPHAQREK